MSPREAALVASLPVDIRRAMTEALQHAPATIAAGLQNAPGRHDSILYPLKEDVLAAAGFNEHDPLPEAKDLTPVQRAIVEILAHRDTFTAFVSPLPMWAASRRRYLGEGPKGVLEKMVPGKRGEPTKVPLWRAVALRRDRRVLLTAKLSLLERLQAAWDINCDAYSLRFGSTTGLEWGKVTEIKGQPELVRFATNCLNQMVASKVGHPGSRDSVFVVPRAVFVQNIAIPLFQAIRTGKVPIDPAWDELLPEPEFPDGKQYLALIASLPEERRGPAARATIGVRTDRIIVIGLALLRQYPTREVMQLVLDNIDKSDVNPKRQTLAALNEIAAESSLVADMLAAFTGKRPKRASITLKAKATRRPRKLADLTPLERKQLAHAGTLWDGKKLAAALRMSSDAKAAETELGHQLEITDLAGTDVGFTLLRYRADSGCVFRAGTIKVVAEIVQDSLECDDPALHEALQLVVGK